MNERYDQTFQRRAPDAGFYCPGNSLIKPIEDRSKMLLILFTFMVLFFGIDGVKARTSVKKRSNYDNVVKIV